MRIYNFLPRGGGWTGLCCSDKAPDWLWWKQTLTPFWMGMFLFHKKQCQIWTHSPHIVSLTFNWTTPKDLRFCKHKNYCNAEQSFPLFISKERTLHYGGVLFLLKTKITVDKLKHTLIFAQIKMFSNLPTWYPLEDNLMNCTFTWHKT